MPKVSVVIVTWNSKDVLPLCLKSLENQTIKDFEVIIVDNGSTDGTVDHLQEKWSHLNLQIKKLAKNAGFSAGNNIGAQLAIGQWLALLNSDAFPEPTWLEKLLEAAELHPEFLFFASRQLQAASPNLLDGAGDAYHFSGFAWRRCSGWSSANYGLESIEVFSPCAAAALYSRAGFLDVAGFDEDFFSYHEDVDLGFRLRLKGYRCLYVAEAVVKHIGSVSVGVQSDFALYHWQRNCIWSFVQNMPTLLFIVALPFHLIANLVYQINYIRYGKGMVVWKAKMDALRKLGRALQKRNQIQRNRKAKNTELWRLMDHGFLQPYLLGYNIRRKSRGSN